MSNAPKETNPSTQSASGRTRRPRNRQKKRDDSKDEAKEGKDPKKQKPSLQKPSLSKQPAPKKDNLGSEAPVVKRAPRRRAKADSGVDGGSKGSSHGSASEHAPQKPSKPSATTSRASTPTTPRKVKPKPMEKPKPAEKSGSKTNNRSKAAGAKKGKEQPSEKSSGAVHEKEKRLRGGKGRQKHEKPPAQKHNGEDKATSKPHVAPAKPSKTLLREQELAAATTEEAPKAKPKPKTLKAPAVKLLQQVKRVVNTRVCVRLLPADLPEHVFWKSIEPALPWFAPEDTGDMVKVDWDVAYRPEPTDGVVSDSEKPEKTEKPERAETKAMLSLAPTRTVQIDVYQSRNICRLDSAPYWRQYVPGKVHKSKSKPPTASRAYILFDTADEVTYFHQRYHGHVFCKNNVVSRALVELAMSQEIPRDFTPTTDATEGTIDDDPDFQAFLNPKSAEELAAAEAAKQVAPKVS
ncbi:hypothetical protein FBU59_001918, partial [Linderina macrospora]